MKVAIFHDYFNKKGGGERLVINLAKALNADIYTGFVDKKKTFDLSGLKVISLGVNKNLPHIIRNIKIAKKFERYKFPRYDIYIFSGVWCISAAKNCKPNILYLHTPPRFLYDLKYYFMSKMNPIKKIFFKRFVDKWKIKDQIYMRNFDVICPNSENVKQRVLTYYGKDLYKKCKVIYTGIETKRYHFKEFGDFYLSTSRLDELKRIDIIIDAFKRMPDKKLIIASSGPDEKRLKKRAKGCENIKFLGAVSEEKLLDLYSRCRAVIVAAKNEDLGLVAIEAQASGKPVIAVAEGGFLETVNERTGIFFQPNFDSLISAIERCEEKFSKKQWNYRIIQRNVKKFDIQNFVKRMKKIIKELVKF